MSPPKHPDKSDRPACVQIEPPAATARHTDACSCTVKPAPLRRCAACRRVAPRSEFLRLIRQYDTGEIRIGLGTGRSAYLCPTKRCVERIRKKNRLRHVLRTTVTDDLFASLLATIEAAETRSDSIEGLVIDE